MFRDASQVESEFSRFQSAKDNFKMSTADLTLEGTAREATEQAYEVLIEPYLVKNCDYPRRTVNKIEI